MVYCTILRSFFLLLLHYNWICRTTSMHYNVASCYSHTWLISIENRCKADVIWNAEDMLYGNSWQARELTTHNHIPQTTPFLIHIWPPDLVSNHIAAYTWAWLEYLLSVIQLFLNMMQERIGRHLRLLMSRDCLDFWDWKAVWKLLMLVVESVVQWELLLLLAAPMWQASQSMSTRSREQSIIMRRWLWNSLHLHYSL